MLVNQDGNITGVNITNSGTGYSTENVVSIVDSTKGIVEFVIDSNGTGYQNGDVIEIQESESGEGFIGTLIVNQDGNITGVNISDSGTGYSTNDIVTINSENGVGGHLSPVLANSGLLTPVLGGSLYLEANLYYPHIRRYYIC